jgi:ankyrin repeat protein
MVPRSAAGRKLLQDLLYFCLHCRRPKAVRWLLAQGADPNLTDPAGRTALHVSVGAGFRTEVLAWLLAAGADVEAKDSAGRSAPDLARVKGHSKATEMMRARARAQNGALSTPSRVLTAH